MSKNSLSVPVFFAAFAEAIRRSFDLMRQHPAKVGIVAAIIVIVSIVLSVLSSQETEVEETPVLTEMPPPPVRPLVNSFILPEEPGKKAEFKPFNEPKARWSEEDAKQHKRPPDEKMLSELHSANEASITQILKEVP